MSRFDLAMIALMIVFIIWSVFDRDWKDVNRIGLILFFYANWRMCESECKR